MKIRSFAIQDNMVFELKPRRKGRSWGFARVMRPWSEPGNGCGSQGGAGKSLRRTSLPLPWMLAGMIGAAFLCPAYAQEPADPIEQGKIDAANDPAEGINREIFEANKYFDDHVLKPVARAFGEDLSPELRQGIHNVATNLGEPLVLANDILQAN